MNAPAITLFRQRDSQANTTSTGITRVVAFIPKLSALNTALFQRHIFKSFTVLVSSASC